MNESTIPKWIIRLGYAWSLVVLPLVWIDTRGDAIDNAIIGMAIGLTVVWMIIGATIQLWLKEKITPTDKRVVMQFTIGATIMALIEEAITTTMTNLATPVWGVSPDEAYITASTNYIEVILLHSVIIFIPMYWCWGYLLDKYDFHHLWVYVLFGITGTLAETLAFGVGNLINIGFWINIYGLTVYLPARRVQKPGRTKPVWYHYLIAILLPIITALPVVFLVLFIRTSLGL